MISRRPVLHSVEAERAVLGACLLSKDALSIAMEVLKPDDFFINRHRTAFEVLISMYSRDIPADYVTFTNELQAKNLYDRVGGSAFVSQLVQDITTTANVEYYAEMIRDHSIRRKLVDTSESISKLASTLDKELSDILDEAEKLLLEAGQNDNSSEFRHVSEIICPVIANIETIRENKGQVIIGYPTGFVDIDAVTGGLLPGELYIIAARPSMGKTTLALNIAQFGVSRLAPVLIFSLEMPAEQIVQRMLAAESEVNLFDLSKGLFDTTAYDAVKAASNALANREIYINDTTSLSAVDFRAKARQFKVHHPNVGLIVVDYLQLMTSGTYRSTTTRVQEIADITRTLKATARELRCTVIALSQLSRDVEKRSDKMPQLADLRDSGAIEQDADVVMMLYREDYYSKTDNNDLTDSRADIRIAKNRNGATGTVSLTFQREITRFRDFGHE